MAKASKGQKETVERVLHEFKQGELASSSGAKVTSRKQAIAIALSEAGESKFVSAAENKRNLARTKSRERSGETARDADEAPKGYGGEVTRAELYEQARRRDIPGRSRMSKDALARALKA